MIELNSRMLAREDSQLSAEELKLKMAMPRRLVVVRHGLSDANVATKAIKKGLVSEYPKGFADIPDREIRLCLEGADQATRTGPWLRQQYPAGFKNVLCSDHTRAKETTALALLAAGWSDQKVRVDALLGERSWGEFADETLERRDQLLLKRKRDPIHSPMPNGESLLMAKGRARDLLGRCARQFGGSDVCVFSHGEFIEALWSEIAHMTTERQKEFFHSPAGNIQNCQVVEFSSQDPFSGEFVGKLSWVRSSCPRLLEFGAWNKIDKPTYTPAELLEQVSTYPRLDLSHLPRSTNSSDNHQQSA